MRIVSMLSSATEIVYALGLGDQLVGISHECDYPREALSLPCVSRTRFDPAGMSSGEIDAAVRRSMEEHGSVYTVDRERLHALEPDLVLTQAVCEVCAVPTAAVMEAVCDLPRAARVLSLDAHTIDQIIDSVEAVAEAAGVVRRGERVAAGLRQRLERVERGVAALPRPKVLMLEWLDPPFAPGHWVPEMIDRAGGECLVGRPGERSLQTDWSALPADAGVLCIEPCGYDLAQARADADRHAELLRRTAPTAVQNGETWLLHSAFYSRSGPRVVDGIEVLARILHADRFPGITLDGRAERWTATTSR